MVDPFNVELAFPVDIIPAKCQWPHRNFPSFLELTVIAKKRNQITHSKSALSLDNETPKKKSIPRLSFQFRIWVLTSKSLFFVVIHKVPLELYQRFFFHACSRFLHHHRHHQQRPTWPLNLFFRFLELLFWCNLSLQLFSFFLSTVSGPKGRKISISWLMCVQKRQTLGRCCQRSWVKF